MTTIETAQQSPNADPGYVPGRGWPDTNAFRGFFAPSRIEADVFDLEVEGDIPPELDGAFYRAAADTQFAPRRGDDIYINGDGMMTMIRFERGHADLRTRYVRTQRFLLERAARQSLFGAYRNPFTDDPRVQGVDDGNANTSVVWHAGRLLALKEAALPYELDPVTLETRGVYTFDGALRGRTFTAHPKIDPLTGEMIAFSYNSSGRPDRDVNLFVISADGQVKRTETFEAPYSSMMHDWLVTRDYMIFTFSPMISDWERMRDEPQYFVWDPPQGTHVAVIPREGGVAGIRWYTSPLVMETHSFNAWREGDTLVADHFVADSGWFSQFPLSTEGYLREKPPFAQRWRLDLTQGAPHWSDADASYDSKQLFDFPGDMPQVDARARMQRNRHAWMGCMNPALGPMPPFGPMGPPFNSIVHRDDDTGLQTGYFVGEDAAPEEPVFVPKGPDAAEGEGWLLSLVGRRRENRNDMIILDALDVAAGPVATLKIPFRLRYGFHGTWVPGEDLRRG
jgi:carotenoid cleavage dioxygenase-like enzyme